MVTRRTLILMLAMLLIGCRPATLTPDRCSRYRELIPA